MNVNSIFLDPKTLEETNGMYGIVAAQMSTFNTQQRFNDQYLNKFMLVEELQNRLNNQAQALCELPPDADRTVETTVWQTLNQILNEVKAL